MKLRLEFKFCIKKTTLLEESLMQDRKIVKRAKNLIEQAITYEQLEKFTS